MLEFSDTGLFASDPLAFQYPYAIDPAPVPTVYNPPASSIYEWGGFTPTPSTTPESSGFNVQDFFRGVTPILSAGAQSAVSAFASGIFGKRQESTTQASLPSRFPLPSFLSPASGGGGLSGFMLPVIVLVGAVLVGLMLFRR